MGTLKLCRDRQAQNPFFLEGLSVSVYTLEELCYAIESNLFLLDEKMDRHIPVSVVGKRTGRGRSDSSFKKTAIEKIHLRMFMNVRN